MVWVGPRMYGVYFEQASQETVWLSQAGKAWLWDSSVLWLMEQTDTRDWLTRSVPMSIHEWRGGKRERGYFTWLSCSYGLRDAVGSTYQMHSIKP